MTIIDRPSQLVRQGPLTVECYLNGAVRVINNCFGVGYAEQHPELVGAFIQACAADYTACLLTDYLSNITYALSGVEASLREQTKAYGGEA